MEDALKKLNTDKRERIINSALREFSENGYKKSSTNTIVKNAGISKGALFHYFANKEELYESLCKFAIYTVKDSIADNLDWEIDDFFERVRQIVIIKVELTSRYPYIYEFFKVMMKDKSPQEIMNLLGGESAELSAKIYSHNINYDYFKEDIDVEKAMKIIRWSMEKLGEEVWGELSLSNEAIDIPKLIDRTENYYEILRTAFYK